MDNTPKEHTLTKSVILHLLPGLLTGAGYFALVPTVINMGYPSVMALSLAGFFILIPFLMLFLLYLKISNGEKLLHGIIRYLKPMKFRHYLLWVPAVVIASALAFKAFGFAEGLLKPMFSGMAPDMFLDMGLSPEFTKTKLISTYGFFLVLIVLVLPALEELYFRGYLLPRMPRKLKGWTVPVHSALFALYHTWTPWLFITRTAGVLPLVYAVKRKESIFVGIIAHCIINSVDFIIGLIYILNMQ